jgi:hypothetical protein
VAAALVFMTYSEQPISLDTAAAGVRLVVLPVSGTCACRAIANHNGSVASQWHMRLQGRCQSQWKAPLWVVPALLACIVALHAGIECLCFSACLSAWCCPFHNFGPDSSQVGLHKNITLLLRTQKLVGIKHCRHVPSARPLAYQRISSNMTRASPELCCLQADLQPMSPAQNHRKLHFVASAGDTAAPAPSSNDHIQL